MKFKYLGTAAAEGWPAVFCNCDHCLRAKEAGGKNLRTRSQTIINEDLLIEFPMDTYHHVLMNRLDLSAVKYCLITHAHTDHFSPVDFVFRNDSYYCHNLTEKEMLLYGNQAVMERLNGYIKLTPEESSKYGITPELMPIYTPVQMDKYTVTAMRANHANGNDAYIYLISDGEKTVLYLHDTGTLYDEVYDYLVKNKIYAHFVSYDCTYVALTSGGGHMGLDTNIETRDKLLELGIIDDKTINCVNHFSHNGKLIYDELVPQAAKSGFLTSYDGMEIEI